MTKPTAIFCRVCGRGYRDGEWLMQSGFPVGICLACHDALPRPPPSPAYQALTDYWNSPEGKAEFARLLAEPCEWQEDPPDTEGWGDDYDNPPDY